MKKLSTSLIILGIFSFSPYLQPVTETSSASNLFDENDILELNLSFDIDETISDLEERGDHEARLSYNDVNGELVDIDLKVSVRGQTRSIKSVCKFPPLELNFKKKGNQGNLFEGQDKLKLVTHCNNPAGYEQYVINEYLIYKAYNLLTNNSFKVRLLRINYVDSSKKDSPLEKYGFLVENIDALASRNQMVEVERNLPNQDMCDHSSLDIFTLFQYMIGNTDWSISTLHNVKLIGPENGNNLIPVPYDFDYSGIESTSYAQPPANLPIQSVQERIFRGFCRKSGEYEKTFNLFQEKKEQIYDTFNKNDLLSSRNKERIRKYLDSFYAVLDNPKKSAKEINGACRIDHVHLK